MRDDRALGQRRRPHDESRRLSPPQASSPIPRDASPLARASSPPTEGPSPARSPPANGGTPGSAAKHLATPGSTSSPDKSHVMETTANR